MANTNLKLLGAWFSPFPLRVKIALNIKSLQYENVEETLNNKSELLLQSNPVYQKIPVLLHGDKPICESRIIVEYIDEVWSSGPSILPEDSYDRAMARFWSAYIDDKLFVAMRKAVFEEDEEARMPYLEEVDDALVRMEGELQKRCREKGKGLFFGGEEIGLVDISFGSLLGVLRVIETMQGRKMIVEEKHPCLVKWAERFESDPNVKGLIPDTEKLIALQMKSKAAAASASANFWTLNPKSELLLHSNPVRQKIRVFLHGNKPICESRIIVEYIDDVWNSGPSILPEDAYDRAMARFWASYIDDKLFVAMRKALSEEDEEARKPHLEEIEDFIVTMEGELQKCCRE